MKSKIVQHHQPTYALIHLYTTGKTIYQQCDNPLVFKKIETREKKRNLKRSMFVCLKSVFRSRQLMVAWANAMVPGEKMYFFDVDQVSKKYSHF
jgi:hypothetical protein